jgi:hypothetical protein
MREMNKWKDWNTIKIRKRYWVIKGVYIMKARKDYFLLQRVINAHQTEIIWLEQWKRNRLFMDLLNLIIQLNLVTIRLLMPMHGILKSKTVPKTLQINWEKSTTN